MVHFEAAPVLGSGEVALEARERKLLTVSRVSISGDARGVEGVLLLTTHRLAWVHGNRTSARAMVLSKLHGTRPIDVCTSLRTAKAELRFTDGTKLRLEFHGTRGATRRDDARAAIHDARITAQWTIDAKLDAQEALRKKQREQDDAARERSAAGAGVAGVRERARQRALRRDETIDSGFASLQALRESAEPLVALARSLQQQQHGDEGRGALVEAMCAAGISAPVTRGAVAGDTKFYREEVAREIATFMESRLPDLGGVITLPDAYCLVMRNRASAELVSPADFSAACAMLPKLQRSAAPVEVVTLSGNVRALQIDDDRGARQLVQLADTHASIDAVDVVRVRGVPLTRALDMMRRAEESGHLVRDEHEGATRYFVNRFDAFVAL